MAPPNDRPRRLDAPVDQLTPPEARLKLHRVQERARILRDPELDDVLAWCDRLVAAQGWLRHDPLCEHHRPPRPGATRCTCGLERAWRGRR